MFTVSQLCQSYLAHVRLMVSSGINEPSTLAWYHAQFKHLDQLGHFPADSLRTYHLAAIPLTNAFVRALKRLYKWAAEEELVPKDPFAKLEVPPCGQRERVLSRDEVCRLFRAVPRTLFRMLFVQLYTIARPGEIRELIWEQIDFERRIILLVEFKGKKKRRDKLRARVIPLPLVVVRLLRNLKRKATGAKPTDHVFFNTRQKPYTKNALVLAMTRARAVAELDASGERVVCYHLRHTTATNAIREGVDLSHLAKVMGHAKTTTTERYTHLNVDDAIAAIDVVSARHRGRKNHSSK